MGIYQGLELKIFSSPSKAEHWHPEIEALFVIEGSVQAAVQENACLLKKEDILLINSSLSHRISGSEDAILCCIKFPWRMVSDILGNSAFVFHCNSAEDQNHPYHDLRSIFRTLVYYYVRETHRTALLMESQLLRLLDCFVEHYLIELNQDAGGKLSDEARLQQIFQFVNRNYQQSMSLSSLAEEMFVSPSTLSRFFKKQTGIGFMDYLNQVRVHAAAIELEHTENNVTKVAVNSGFSNLSVFNRAFRDQYGMSPTEYRKERKESARQEQESEQQYLELLREQLKDTDLSALAAPVQTERKQRVSVHVNGGSGVPYRKNWNQVINIGPAWQLTQANLQSHILTLTEHLGFSCVRLWNIFSQKLMITDGTRIGGYNYDMIDSVLDFLVANHIYPYLDFGNRPDTITKNEGETIFQEYVYIPFQSRRAWEHLIRDFIRHIIKRYGKDEVSQWIFELTYIYSPDDFDACYSDESEPFQFMNAFQFFYQTIKEYLPHALVGGFGSIVDWQVPFQRQFMLDCRTRGCIPDFFSVTVYPYFCKPDEDHPLPQRSSDVNWEETQIAQARQLLKETGPDDCKLFVCEWSNTFSNRNYLNDSCYRSAYIAQKLCKIWNSADLIAFSIGSDWVGSHFDTYRVVNGNMGLLSLSNIRKPAFFALQFMNMLGSWLVDRGENYIVTRTQHGTYYILCFNQKRFSSSYYLNEEGSWQPDQLNDLFEDQDSIDLIFTLDHMPQDAVYTVKARRINDSEGSILSEWGKFQYESYLEGHDVKYLRETCFPRMAMKKLNVKGGMLQFKETVEANEVVLLHVYERN